MIPWTNYKMNSVNTKDNADLFYYEQSPVVKQKGILVILPGWSYTADSWSPVLLTNEYLINYYRVFIVINRGYNNKYFGYGNTLEQYSRDIYEFIENKKLFNISLLGHSLGCALIWNIIHMYGESRFKNFIIVDEAPLLLKENMNNNIKITKKMEKQLGAVYDKNALNNATKLLQGSLEEANKYKMGFTKKLFSKEFIKTNADTVKKVSEGTLMFNNKVLSQMLYNATMNHNMEKLFKDNKIKRPSLLIGAKGSIVPYESILYQRKFYVNPTVYIFKNASHSMFIEKYTLFNKVLDVFLKKSNNNSNNKKTKKGNKNNVSKTKKMRKI